MEGLDKGGQGPISGCCAIEEEEEICYFRQETGRSMPYFRAQLKGN
jgi:hypothetical protein